MINNEKSFILYKKPEYFEYNKINNEILYDIIYKINNDKNINKEVIERIIILFFFIINKTIEQRKIIKINKFGKIYINKKNIMYYKPARYIIDNINSLENEGIKLNIFKKIYVDNKYKILDINESKIENKDKNIEKYKKKHKKLKITKNIELDKIEFALNKRIISRITIIDLIQIYSEVQNLTKQGISSIIKLLIDIFYEAFIHGIRIEINNFGNFYPKKNKWVKGIAAYSLYSKGVFKTYEFKGRLTIGFHRCRNI